MRSPAGFGNLSRAERPAPHLVVEVLSTEATRDTIRKFAKYAEAGLERYWIIDPEGPVIIVYHLDGEVDVEQARHQPGTTVELDVGPATLSRLFPLEWGVKVG